MQTLTRCIILLREVLSRPDYPGRQFEVDNILFWMERELKLMEIMNHD